jgi:hypothetical protein
MAVQIAGFTRAAMRRPHHGFEFHAPIGGLNRLADQTIESWDRIRNTNVGAHEAWPRFRMGLAIFERNPEPS